MQEYTDTLLKTIRLYWCVYLVNVLRVIITHRCHALSSLSFLPFCFVFDLTFYLVLPFLQQFFSHLCSLQFSSVMHSLLFSLSLLPLLTFLNLSLSSPPLLSIQITLLHFSTPPPPGFLHVFSFSFYPFFPVCPFFHPFSLKSDGPRRWQADSSVMCIHWASCHPTLFCQICNKLPLLYWYMDNTSKNQIHHINYWDTVWMVQQGCACQCESLMIAAILPAGMFGLHTKKHVLHVWMQHRENPQRFLSHFAPGINILPEWSLHSVQRQLGRNY